MMTTLSCTILIVDDEPRLRRSLAAILEKAGYRVMTAGTGREALLCFKDQVFDLIFLDLKLPDGNGIELLPEFRCIDPEIPVLIMTAHATLETAIGAVRQGARDYLLKPLAPAKVLARLDEILADREQSGRRREIVTRMQSLLSELNHGEALQTKSWKEQYQPFNDERYFIQGNMTLDLHTHQVLLNDQWVRIGPTTFNYLVSLVKHAPKPVSYENLAGEAQGYNLTRIEAREIVAWHIHELRKALASDHQNPQYIQTVRNIGYRLLI